MFHSQPLFTISFAKAFQKIFFLHVKCPLSGRIVWYISEKYFQRKILICLLGIYNQYSGVMSRVSKIKKKQNNKQNTQNSFGPSGKKKKIKRLGSVEKWKNIMKALQECHVDPVSLVCKGKKKKFQKRTRY